MADDTGERMRWARAFVARRQVRIAVLVTAMSLAAAAFVMAALILGQYLPSSIDPDGRRVLWLTFTIIVVGAVASIALAISMTTFVVEDSVIDRRRMPGLYWPIYGVKTLLPVQLCISGAQGIDLIVHGLQPRWHIFYTPGARLFQALIILGIVVALMWLHLAMLEGRGWKRQQRIALVVGIGAIAVIVVVLVVIDSIIN